MSESNFHPFKLCFWHSSCKHVIFLEFVTNYCIQQIFNKVLRLFYLVISWNFRKLECVVIVNYFLTKPLDKFKISNYIFALNRQRPSYLRRYRLIYKLYLVDEFICDNYNSNHDCSFQELKITHKERQNKSFGFLRPGRSERSIYPRYNIFVYSDRFH